VVDSLEEGEVIEGLKEEVAEVAEVLRSTSSATDPVPVKVLLYLVEKLWYFSFTLCLITHLAIFCRAFSCCSFLCLRFK
jgi:hypothetical protein